MKKFRKIPLSFLPILLVEHAASSDLPEVGYLLSERMSLIAVILFWAALPRVLQRAFPNAKLSNRASCNLLDYTYPHDLFDIILSRAEWNRVFKSIFGHDDQYWRVRGRFLAKVRNSLAHNRDESLYEHERQIAEAYCKEILTVLKV